MPSTNPDDDEEEGCLSPRGIYSDASEDNASRVSRENCNVPSPSAVGGDHYLTRQLEAQTSQQEEPRLLSTGELLGVLMPDHHLHQEQVSTVTQSSAFTAVAEQKGSNLSSPAPSLTDTEVSPISDSQEPTGIEQGFASLLVTTTQEPNPNSPPAVKSSPLRAKTENAKDEFHKYYDPKDVRLLRKNRNFISFRMHNDDDHVPKWTCYVVVPEGYYFAAGNLITRDETTFLEKGGLYWYGTQGEAMRAAAGRAMDCIRRRDTARDPSSRHCVDHPTWPPPQALPRAYPDEVEKILAILRLYGF